jgi:hypothetical protein
MAFKNCEECQSPFEDKKHPTKRFCNARCFSDSRVIAAGTRFGRWTVIRLAAKVPNYRYECVCECGKVGYPILSNLRKGVSKSCGCIQREMMRKNQTVHGYSGEVEYTAFINARNRCQNPNDISYKNYGGRGIQFKFDNYEEWLAELGRRPSPDHTVDRKLNDGNYEKGNVQWATRHEQRVNQRPRSRISIRKL